MKLESFLLPHPDKVDDRNQSYFGTYEGHLTDRHGHLYSSLMHRMSTDEK